MAYKEVHFGKIKYLANVRNIALQMRTLISRWGLLKTSQETIQVS